MERPETVSAYFERAANRHAAMPHDIRALLYREYDKMMASCRRATMSVAAALAMTGEPCRLVPGGSVLAGTVLAGETPDLNLNILLDGDEGERRAGILSAALEKMIPLVPGWRGDRINKVAYDRFHRGPLEGVGIKLRIRPEEGYRSLGDHLGALPVPMLSGYIRLKSDIKSGGDTAAYAAFKRAVYGFVADMVESSALDVAGARDQTLLEAGLNTLRARTGIDLEGARILRPNAP